MQRLVVLSAMALWTIGCSNSKDGKPQHGGPSQAQPGSGQSAGVAARPAKGTSRSARPAPREVKGMKVSSSAFEAGKAIPKKYAYRGEGDNISPPLSWTGAPADVKAYVLLVEDPDAPSPKNPRPKPWVHWVLYDIPASVTSLSEGKSAGIQGKNDFGETAWGGPMPPPGSGTHRYFFRVYVLDAKLGMAPGATRDQVLSAMKGHIIAQGEVYGTYSR